MRILAFALLLVMLAACGREAVDTANAVEPVPAASEYRWELVRSHADFEPRDSARAFRFDGDWWLSNGYVELGNTLHDLWRSGDGVHWTKVLDQTPYDEFSGVTAYDGWIWAAQWSVWRSRDGKDWEKVLDDPPFSTGGDNAEARLRNFNGKLWCLCVTGIWSSTDGVDWKKAPDPPFAGRRSYASVVWQERLWVVGGAERIPEPQLEAGYPDLRDTNEVWSSADGESWTLEAAHAEWGPRMWPGLVVHKDELWLFGGYYNEEDRNRGGTWKTSDGKTWERVEAGPGPSPRHFPTVLSVGDDILLIAGNAWPVQNDIWRLRTERAE